MQNHVHKFERCQRNSRNKTQNKRRLMAFLIWFGEIISVVDRDLLHTKVNFNSGSCRVFTCRLLNLPQAPKWERESIEYSDQSIQGPHMNDSKLSKGKKMFYSNFWFWQLQNKQKNSLRIKTNCSEGKTLASGDSEM